MYSQLITLLTGIKTLPLLPVWALLLWSVNNAKKNKQICWSKCRGANSSGVKRWQIPFASHFDSNFNQDHLHLHLTPASSWATVRASSSSNFLIPSLWKKYWSGWVVEFGYLNSLNANVGKGKLIHGTFFSYILFVLFLVQISNNS